MWLLFSAEPPDLNFSCISATLYPMREAVIKLMGGLGNQLQQYSLYRKFVSLGLPASIDDKTWFQNIPLSATARKNILKEIIKTPYREADSMDIYRKSGRLPRHIPGLKDRYYLENTDDREGGKQYDPDVFGLGDCYLEGFWACEAYYGDILAMIRDDLILPDAPLMEHMEGNSVSIHVRRQDYLDPGNAALFGGIATDDYYHAALAHIESLVGGVHVFIFTDDPVFFASRPGYFTDSGNETLVSSRDKGMLQDLSLMRSCRHHICSNSTYAFWGARLGTGDGISVRPSIHKNTQIYNADDMHEWWKGWTIIDPSGNVV